MSSKFEGSAQFIPQNQGGGRHYQTVSAGMNARPSNGNLRYVSEEDITINAK